MSQTVGTVILAAFVLLSQAVGAVTLEIEFGGWWISSLLDNDGAFTCLSAECDRSGFAGNGFEIWVPAGVAIAAGMFPPFNLTLDGVTYPHAPELVGPGDINLFIGGGLAGPGVTPPDLRVPFTTNGWIDVIDPITQAPLRFDVVGRGESWWESIDFDSAGNPCPGCGALLITSFVPFGSVPEPSTLLLLAAGIGVLIVTKRRGR